MANVDKPMGALVVKNLSGGSLIASQHLTISATIFKNDFVIQEATGSIDIAVAAVDLLGTAAHHSTGDNQEQHIYDSPGTIFMIQAAGTEQQADMWGSGELLATTGDTVTLISKHEINTVSTGAAQLIVLDKVDRPDNVWGANVDLLVMIHEYERAPLPATPGGI